jgi:hypothetical protein
MILESTKTAVLAVLAIDPGVDAGLKAAVASVLTGGSARISAPQAARLLGVSKRTLLRNIAGGKWPLAVDYENRTHSFCYRAQVEALLHGEEVPAIEDLGVSPRPQPAMNFCPQET